MRSRFRMRVKGNGLPPAIGRMVRLVLSDRVINMSVAGPPLIRKVPGNPTWL